jgi:hypothetical protein
MAFLTLNGVEIPVSSTAGATIERVRQGEYGRTATHAARSFVNASSDARKATTTLAINSTALMYQQVIRGLGHVWSFNDGLYSSKGLGPIPPLPVGYSILADAGVSGGDPALQIVEDTALVYINPYYLTGAWTLAAWSDKEGEGYYHYTWTSTGDTYGNGVLGANVGAEYIATAGTITMGVPGGVGNVSFDEMILLPYVVPATWPAWVYALGVAGTPLPPLSYVLAEGDWYGSATQVLGDVGNGRTQQWTDSGTLKTGEAFEFTLHRREVA